ncbi:DEAD/DEAH box helicase [Duodenibacillus massiliensis]
MQELTPLLFKAIPQLRLLGVKVILPKSLRKLLAPQATMQIDLAENWDVSQGFMGLMDLLDFDWKVAVGGEAISREELKALSAMAGRVVRFHDSFMFVDEKELTRIRNRIEAQKQGLTKMAILRAALTGDMDSSPVQLTEAVRTALQRLLKETDTPIPATVKATLRPYQERGYRWMMRNVRIGIGSILADDMGLGKTLQVITLLEGLRTRRELKGKPALIVVPTSLITNWQRETARFAPKLKLHVYYGPGRALPGEKETVHAVLTTYGTLRSSVNTLAERAWRLLILDEAQAVKNYRTSTFKSVRTVKADGVVAMSGTPVENRLMEYWSIMEATNPGLLGSATGFKNTFAQPIEIEHDEETAEQFKRVTAPFILRRLKTDKAIAPELPQKISTDEYCTLTKEQALLYDKVVKKSLEQINDGMSPMERRAMVLTLMMKLKQICNAPAQYAKDGSYASAEYSGKMQRLFGILEDLEAAGRKVLIFTQFREMGKLLQKWIGEKTGSTPKFIHGGVAQKERQAIVDSFQTNRSDKVLILSLKAAGTGLNLTAATAIIHYDLWWNPAVENQATDRAYRIGQKSSVNVYRFISAETFEEKINTMIESKKALAEMTVETGENWIGDLSKNELQEIFTLQTH